MRPLPLCIVLLAFALEVGSAAQAGRSVEPASPSGVIAGTVVDRQTRAPVRFATVRLLTPDSMAASRMVAADAEGRFEFRGLAGGSYTIAAARADYLPTPQPGGPPGAARTSIALGEGERLENVVVPMSRGGVITGRVLDEFGDPVPGVPVHVMRRGLDDPAAGGLAALSSRSDDRGAYRLFLIEPGAYYVLAQLTPQPTLRASGSTGHVSTYYPDAIDSNDARQVPVIDGVESAGIDIRLASARLARVSGRALSSSGRPLVGVPLTLQRRHPAMSFTSTTATIAGDGRFVLDGVPPGRFVVSAELKGRGREDDEKGQADVVVAGRDLDDVQIVTRRGAVLRGIVVTESDVRLPIPARALTVRPVPARDEGGPAMAAAPVADDLTFELTNLHGRHRLELTMATPFGHWAVKAIRWQGEDMTIRPFEFSGQRLDGVEIVLSDRWATVSGVVRDGAGAPVRDAWLVLFPVDPTLRVPGSRYVREMRTDTGGRFGVSSLMAGEYLLAAPPTLQTGPSRDAAFLEALAASALRLTLDDDDEAVVEVRVRQE